MPPARTRYLAEIADTVRGYKAKSRAQPRLAREMQQLRAAAAMLEVGKPGKAKASPKPPWIWPEREDRMDPPPASWWPSGPPCKKPTRRRVRGENPRQGNPHRAHHQIARHHHPQGVPAAVRMPR